MDVIDVNEGSFQEVEIKGHMALFTELRVDKNTIPEGVNCYELCHGDDDSYPAALEQSVRVNYFGAVLMADKVELGKEGYVPLEYEDFGFTGEDLTMSEYRANYLEEPKRFLSGADFAGFMNKREEPFPLTEKEADILLGYLQGSDFVLGEMEGNLFRGDTDYTPGVETRWMEDTIDDVVNAAYEWNDEMIKLSEAQIVMAETSSECEKEKERLEFLREDEQILDALFDRTKYGKEIEELAEELIRDIQSEDGIDGAIQRMKEAIREGKDLLPEVSPELKKGGRAR